jgi:hypothetical protein
MTDFVARRALWLTLTSFAFAFCLFALTLANLWRQWTLGESLATGLLFAFVAGYYAGQTFLQLRDRRPQLTISAAGIHVPAAAPDPIPWSRIQNLRVTRRAIPTLGGQIDVHVDLETFARLKLGQRFMGDFVVKRRGVPNTFTVLTQGLDRRIGDIEAAVKQFQP